MTISQARLKQLLDYDPATGVFTRKTRAYRSRWQIGSVAGSINHAGYVAIRLDGKSDMAHRLAWLWVHGVWPSIDMDHLNGDRADNRLANLRVVGNAVNRQNLRHARSDSQTGVQGVTMDKRRGTFFSRVRVDGATYWLGSFEDPGAAHQAYVAAKRELHVGCTI